MEALQKQKCFGDVRWYFSKKLAKSRRYIAAKKEFWQMMGATKLHGCYRLYAGKTYAKVFWLLIMICTGITFIKIAATLLYLYRNSNVDTQVEIIYDYADNPIVSICTYNVMRKSYIEELMKTNGFSVDLLHYLMHVYSTLESYTSTVDAEDMNRGQQLLDAYMSTYPNFTIPTFIADASQRCEDFILKCLYDGTEFNCCDPRYTSPIMTDLGRCYQMDLDKMEHDLSPDYKFGDVEGLQMLLDYRTDEEVPFFNSTDYVFHNGSAVTIRRPFFNTFEDGFRIYVHNRMSVSFMSTEIISVSPSNKIAIALRPTKYEFLERSKGGACRSTWPPGYYHHQQTPYSQTLCQALCIAHTYSRTCGCAPLRFNLMKDAKTCTPKQQFDCIASKFHISNVTGLRELIPQCSECAPQCQNFVYYSHNSYAHGILPATLQYMQEMGSRFTPNYVRQNLVGVSVFFEAKKFVLYSQSTLSDLTNVLSNIGGNLGLFHGASVISLFEMLVVIFKVIWSLFSNNRRDYMESKQMKEDARKKRLEEILTDTKLCVCESSQQSQISEGTRSLAISSVDERPNIPTIKEEDENDTRIGELSVEKLQIKMVKGERRQRSGTISFFVTAEVANVLLDENGGLSESTIQVGFHNNKIVVPRRKTITRARSHTVV